MKFKFNNKTTNRKLQSIQEANNYESIIAGFDFWTNDEAIDDMDIPGYWSGRLTIHPLAPDGDTVNFEVNVATTIDESNWSVVPNSVTITWLSDEYGDPQGDAVDFGIPTTYTDASSFKAAIKKLMRILPKRYEEVWGQ